MLVREESSGGKGSVGPLRIQPELVDVIWRERSQVAGDHGKPASSGLVNDLGGRLPVAWRSQQNSIRVRRAESFQHSASIRQHDCLAGGLLFGLAQGALDVLVSDQRNNHHDEQNHEKRERQRYPPPARAFWNRLRRRNRMSQRLGIWDGAQGHFLPRGHLRISAAQRERRHSACGLLKAAQSAPRDRKADCASLSRVTRRGPELRRSCSRNHSCSRRANTGNPACNRNKPGRRSCRW